MNSTTLTKVALSLGGAVGVSTAVGIPVVLHFQNKEESAPRNSQIPVVTKVAISQCEASNQLRGNAIDFGDIPRQKDICGELKGGNQTLDKTAQYTTFFQEQWANKDQEGNNFDPNKQGTQECKQQGNSNSGKIFKDSNSSDLVRYLGFCGETSEGKLSFVKKRKQPGRSENAERWELLICEKDCWKNNPGTIENNQQLFTIEERDNGKEVEFYIKKRN